jgi:bis(5'-nucleosidyl)-tetraphosphatase
VKTIRSAGIIVYRKNKDTAEFLLLLYPGGYWEFPKGKLEPGETKEQAAHRELKEETNLTVRLDNGFEETIAYSFKDRTGSTVLKEVYFFVGEAQPGQVILSPEHRDYLWLPFEAAMNRIEHHNAQELLTKVHTFISGK